MTDEDGRLGDGVLLRYLSENTVEVKAPKGASEFLFQILGENLYKPSPPRTWDHLIAGNKHLESSCYHPSMWNLVTSAYSVSPALYKSWVLRPEELYKTASSQCSKVRAGPFLPVEPVSSPTFVSSRLRSWCICLTD